MTLDTAFVRTFKGRGRVCKDEDEIVGGNAVIWSYVDSASEHGWCCTGSWRPRLGHERRFRSTDDGISHSAEAIHQEPIFAANPKRVYDALADAEQFQQVQMLSAAMKALDLVSKPAEISRDLGGSFRLFGGYIPGRRD
jgi:hypothetical protein